MVFIPTNVFMFDLSYNAFFIIWSTCDRRFICSQWLIHKVYFPLGHCFFLPLPFSFRKKPIFSRFPRCESFNSSLFIKGRDQHSDLDSSYCISIQAPGKVSIPHLRVSSKAQNAEVIYVVVLDCVCVCVHFHTFTWILRNKTKSSVQSVLYIAPCKSILMAISTLIVKSKNPNCTVEFIQLSKKESS